MAPGALSQVLKGLPGRADPDLLVGSATSDDAGVYRLGPGLALVQTVDFFPPTVDDPADFGRIAAANALSDVYAMGARPLTAMNIVGWPKALDLSVLAEVLRGGREKLDEAGCALVGGHTVVDAEVKFGLSVTGLVDPARMTTNAAAGAGEVLVLTKPLGTGAVMTAIKAGKASAEEISAAVASMSRLNKTAAEAMAAAGARCATDVTGFGLLGHASHIARESKVLLRFKASALPWLPGALRLSKEGVRTGALGRNRDWLGASVRIDPAVPAEVQGLLFEAETSGGLLICIRADRAGSLPGPVVGEVLEARADSVRLEVVP